MGMSATQARYLNLIAQQSDLEFQGQQINESRTTLSEQTNNLYSQLQNLSVPTPPHTSDFTTIQYSGALSADSFTIGKIVPSGSTYTLNLDFNKAGNSTFSAGKAEVKETPSKVYAVKLPESETEQKTVNTVTDDGLIGAGNTIEDGKPILHKVSSQEELDEVLALNDGAKTYIQQNGKFLEAGSTLSDDDFKSGVYVKINAINEETGVDEDGNPIVTREKNYNPETDYKFKGDGLPETFKPSVTLDEISSYYVSDGNGGVRRATTSDFKYDNTKKVYYFEEDETYYRASKKDAEGAEEFTNPDFSEGIGKSLNGNPLMDSEAGMDKYLTEEQKTSAIEALRNGFPEYAEYSDAELLDLFYVSFSTEGSLKIPHFTLKSDLNTLTDGSTTQWAEFYDITSTGTYTKTSTYEDCQLTFDTKGRITKISVPVTGADGNVVYHSIDVEANTVTDEKAYDEAYNKYEYSKYEYDKEQLKINAQMSIIQAQDKKLELKLQRLDSERTQITTEIDALKKVLGDNIEKSYKTFSG